MKTVTFFLAAMLMLSACGKDKETSDSQQTSKGIFWVGENWSRVILTPEIYDIQVRPVQKLLHHSVKITGPKGHGSGIYLGKNLVLTNHHVVKNLDCNQLKIQLGPTSADISCKNITWQDQDVDAALIKVDGPELSRLPDYELKDEDLPTKGTLLAVAGFGTIANPTHQLTFEVGGDCQVLSKQEMRFMPPPGTSPELAYNVWAVPVGCDTSPGDSGAAVINLATGDIAGIVFGGRLKKRGPVSVNDHKEIWDQMSYIVPISEIIKRMPVSDN